MEANEAKQMEMLLQEGGIADDGTTVDPVSGNEVPPGSMAEEVRDDVPAQLSEGEYVVPADVTRYYGVKFFEDLRTQAKQGMGQMEAEGRIGGEPVSQTMDNQAEGALTPEELAMLQEMGMAVGGMVTPPPQAIGNTGEYNKGGQVLYAQDGVDVSAANASTSGVNPYQAQFTQGMGTAFAPGYLTQQIIDTAQAPQSTVVMLYSPDGIAVAVSLPAEKAKYDQLIAEGYTTEPVATTTESVVRTDDDDDTPPTVTAKPVDYSKMSKEQLEQAYARNQTASIMMAGMTAINPLFAAFGSWATNKTRNNILSVMEDKGYSPPETGSIFDISINDVIGKFKNIFGLNEDETASLVANTREANISKGNDAKKDPVVKQGGDDPYVPVVKESGTYTTDEDSGITTVVPSQEIKDSVSIPEASDDLNPFGGAGPDIQSDNSSSYGVGTYNTETRSGGFNAGGFVSKRSKKKKKK